MKRAVAAALLSTLLATSVAASPPMRAIPPEELTMHAGALEHALDRIDHTARVLYVAAHPDDENTRLLAYLANHRHLEVAYLSLTRGGGGQNLIGPEQGSLLAAIRTQELLAARRIDGARQFFTRARDFGYSKRPEEALDKWGRDAVLFDVVWVIRRFRPDVVVTRFTEDGATHGHHTASAQLARAAYEAAADPARFPEQLTRGVTPWPAHRLVLNVPRWGKSDDDVSGYLALDVGGYDPRLGASYPELAAKSRTMHKSQGFGSAGQRGPVMEYFEALAGPAPKGDLLDGVTLGWDRFEGGEAVSEALAAARAAFSSRAPEHIVPHLQRARAALSSIAERRPVPRVTEARDRVDALIAAALGLYASASASQGEVASGAGLEVALEVVLRRPAEVTLREVRWPDGHAESPGAVAQHRPVELTRRVTVDAREAPSVPHWLRGAVTDDVYAVPEPARVAAPEDPPPLAVELLLSAAVAPPGAELAARGTSGSAAAAEPVSIRLRVPVERRWTDRVQGERAHEVAIVPPLTVTPTQRTTLLPKGLPGQVSLTVRAGLDAVQGEVGLEVPAGWRVRPSARRVALARAGAQATLRFEVTPPAKDARPVTATPFARVAGQTHRLRRDVIDHPHIPVQVVLQQASIRLAPLDFVPPSGRVGYVPGPGDEVAAYLGAAGVDVEIVDSATLRAGDFSRYETILVGVRAFNTREEELEAAHGALMRWVKAGGRLVVQYNTSNRWRRLEAELGPYPFEIDRGRVTDEAAVLTPLVKDHPILTSPHRLTGRDFEGWVQERGLYFASKWDERYTPIFAANDPGEVPLQGSLLVADYGEGAFVYTGLSFFRQLPAGVPGAYRLLGNILSYGGRP